MHTESTAAAVHRPRPRPHADRVLVCLSYCGGGTAPFRQWAKTLPDDVELALICYPGREARFGTPFARDWVALRDDVVRAVRGLTDRPYVLFGHSMGSWMAFETAARLERLGVAPPSALVVSGGVAPHKRREVRSHVPRSDDSDEALVRWMREFGQMTAVVANEPELVKLAVELLRADLAVSESYRFVEGSRVSVPLRVLYGAEDSEPFDDVERHWRSLTDGAFEAVELPGGHFYTPDVWSRLPEWCSLPVPRTAR
ncbi:alpha/beta fold hydrolase [Streptomyces sp. TRM43335]|uniref:Alpha/beta fold hydrolase n=1 Tax=Streptomyces taklimakanensis TaxID=2569853 RepID=A0A6G2BKW4_9ACTN|nr:alpha/beta fold hydrolase [Streptomyces taklimakanensis]MTE22542.1 alpha/beta fold hydrolase [Streptomyces taklimakanensis]